MRGPRRIVCLTEETTELLYLLGEEERIVGISAYTVRPPRAKREKPVVSAFLSGSVSKIKAARPDLVVGFSDIQADLARELIAEGLPVLITNQRSIEEILGTVEWIGSLVGQGDRSRQLTDSWRARLEDVARAQKKLRPIRVFFQEWDEPCISAIRWVSELLELAGGADIFAEVRGESLARARIVEAAEVVKRQPEAVVGSWCGKPVDFDWVRAAFASTPAVRRGALYEMDPAVILQPGPALFLSGLDQLVECIARARRASDC